MRGFLLAAALLAASTVLAQSNPNWDPDYNNDNTIGVADLLGLLGVFEEQDSDDDGIFDSQDDCVGVYDPCGVCNGDGVDADLDGVCDDVDDCVGDYDECGVCNGQGPDWPMVESIEQFFDSVYIDQIDFWYVFQTGADTTFSYVCATAGCTDATAGNFNPDAVIDDGSCTYGPEQCGGMSTVTYDGHTYDLVAIGEQCWFAENLRNTHYANGDEIPGELTDAEWENTATGAQAINGAGSSTCWSELCDEVANFEDYGRLYNWHAVDDARGLCPSSWHVPTDGEWMTLEMELGMSSSEANSTGTRGSGQGAMMKASGTDSPGWDGTNSSGFSGLPGGTRRDYGLFDGGGSVAHFWSSSQETLNAWMRGLVPNDAPSGSLGVYRYTVSQRYGFSVRCVRD